MWVPEHKKVFPIFQSPLIKKQMDWKPELFNNHWHENPEFWEQVYEQIPNIKQLYFAGGEPLIMPEHWKILDMLVQEKKFNVSLRYSTNGTTLGTLKHNVLDTWRKFKYVHLSLSIDGAGDTFEHIRYNGKWVETLENLKKIRESKAVDYWFHPTVSILNIFRLTELHNELHINDLMPLSSIHPRRGFCLENYWVDRFHLNPLFMPDYYSITSLPAKLKDRAADSISLYGRNLELNTGIPFSGWKNIIDFMYHKDTSHLWSLFKQKSTQLDTIRRTNIFKINPELLDE